MQGLATLQERTHRRSAGLREDTGNLHAIFTVRQSQACVVTTREPEPLGWETIPDLGRYGRKRKTRPKRDSSVP